MADDMLSRAVVAYVWGDPRGFLPAAYTDAVRNLFGDQAERLLTSIDTLCEDLNHIRPDSDLAAYGRVIEDHLRSHHPELSDAARRALSAKYTHIWR